VRAGQRARSRPRSRSGRSAHSRSAPAPLRFRRRCSGGGSPRREGRRQRSAPRGGAALVAACRRQIESVGRSAPSQGQGQGQGQRSRSRPLRPLRAVFKSGFNLSRHSCRRRRNPASQNYSRCNGGNKVFCRPTWRKARSAPVHRGTELSEPLRSRISSRHTLRSFFCTAPLTRVLSLFFAVLSPFFVS